jgi:hypothetical protein
MALQYVRRIESLYPLYMRETTTNFTIDAAGESCCVIGRVVLDGGAIGKTISAAGGGRIFIRPSTITFANGSTNLRVGFAQMSSGLDNGTYDVHGDLTGGGGGLTAGVINSVDLTTGTKTIGTGSLVAVAIEMTARGGADSVTIRGLSANAINGETDLGFPYGTNDVGAGVVRQNARLPWVMFQTDDGTVGWIEWVTTFPLSNSAIAFNDGSTPDEYCAVWTQTHAMRISDIGFPVFNTAGADSFLPSLYRDPLGTPVLVDIAGSVTTNYSSATVGVPNHGPMSSDQVLVAGQTYGISVAPGPSNVSIPYVDLGSGFDILKACLPYGTSTRLAARTNTSGAFSVTQDYHVPYAFMVVNGLHDGGALGRGIGRGM